MSPCKLLKPFLKQLAIISAVFICVIGIESTTLDRKHVLAETAGDPKRKAVRVQSNRGIFYKSDNKLQEALLAK